MVKVHRMTMAMRGVSCARLRDYSERQGREISKANTFMRARPVSCADVTTRSAATRPTHPLRIPIRISCQLGGRQVRYGPLSPEAPTFKRKRRDRKIFCSLACPDFLFLTDIHS